MRRCDRPVGAEPELSSCVPSGVYQWDASYSGDSNNKATSDNNDLAEQVTVVSPCCNLTGITYSVYNPNTPNIPPTTPADLSGNTQQGDTITVTFTVPAGSYDQISLVSYNAPEGFYNANDANLQTVFQSVTQVEGPGTHSLSVNLPLNFYQVDFVCGTVITTLGPASTNPNNFYHAQNRFIDGDNGGVNPVGSLSALSVTGEVYNDVNLNGKLDSTGDQAVCNATVTLTGTDAYGNSISATTTTNGSGLYTFSGLPYSNSAGYAVTVSPPSGYTAGEATVGKVNGTADGSAATSPERVQGIVLASSSQTTGTGYNLGVITLPCVTGSTYPVVVLNTTAAGALTLSGSAKVSVAGAVVVDSSAANAISGSSGTSVSASIIDVVGNVTGAAFSPAPSTGAASLADPLFSLVTPGTTGLTNYHAYSLASGTGSISQGIYSSINITGGTLTMSPGTYIIEGGGFKVSGAASVTGTGVTIFNAGGSYPTLGGTFGSISLGGTGTIKLSAPTSGTYAGILIFQSRDNPNTLSINVSTANSAITGTIYAACAQLSDSGSTPLNGSLVVNSLNVSGSGVANALSLNTPAGSVAYTPAQVRAAYGISNLALDGTGQTIAIVDAYDDPSIYQALDAFDTQFGLTGSGPTLAQQYGPASSFLTVLNQNGQTTSLPGTDPSGPGTDNWAVEIALDVEWTHAIAPGAQIVLVEANSQSLSDLMTGVATAASQPGVSVVTMSWGFPEGQAVFAADEANYDSTFNVLGVTFLASTGDYGTADPEYPAFSPNVVAVGGTSLNLNADNSPFEVVGGTSLSAPAFSGLVALVNQGRVAAGEANLNSSSPTETPQALYSLPQSDYNSITSGSNGYTANAGYNLVTGLGTPVANLMVPDLVAYQGLGTSYAGPTVSPLQDATLSSTWSSGGSTTNVFSVFSALTVSSSGLGHGQGLGAASAISTSLGGTPAQGMAANHTATTPVTAAGTTLGLATGSFDHLREPGRIAGNRSGSHRRIHPDKVPDGPGVRLRPGRAGRRFGRAGSAPRGWNHHDPGPPAGQGHWRPGHWRSPPAGGPAPAAHRFRGTAGVSGPGSRFLGWRRHHGPESAVRRPVSPKATAQANAEERLTVGWAGASHRRAGWLLQSLDLVINAR
ncbi:MAG: SdrD B-like domain-containing protein [Isosphaerales bacterium]